MAGIEINPRPDNASGELSPPLNWLAMPETERRPALILGASSDRIDLLHRPARPYNVGDIPSAKALDNG